MAVDVDHEYGKVLSSNMTYIKNEDIDALRFENGKLTVLSKESRTGHERVFDVDSGDFTEDKNYKVVGGRDDILMFGTIYTSLGSGILGALVSPWALIPISSLLYVPLHYLPRAKATGKHNEKAEEFKNANWEEARSIISNEIQKINIYQMSISELEKQTGKKLELVETGESRKFIEEKDDFWLKAKASALGADAIVHFQSGSPLRGTPVRFVDEK